MLCQWRCYIDPTKLKDCHSYYFSSRGSNGFGFHPELPTVWQKLDSSVWPSIQAGSAYGGRIAEVHQSRCKEVTEYFFRLPRVVRLNFIVTDAWVCDGWGPSACGLTLNNTANAKSGLGWSWDGSFCFVCFLSQASILEFQLRKTSVVHDVPAGPHKALLCSRSQ